MSAGSENVTTTTTTKRKITLRSSDGETLEVDEAVALQLETIKPLVEKDSADIDIHIPDVSYYTLSKVIEYCERHVDSSSSSEDDSNSSNNFIDGTLFDLNAWDADFVEVSYSTVFNLILAANYLNVKSLLDLTSQAVGDMIKGKTPEEIRKMFNISTPVFDIDKEEEGGETAGI